MALASATCSTISNLLRSRILMSGPIPVADYMRLALTAQSGNGNILGKNSGYYMKNDVFGQHGDFTTSPEITQLFGEMLGVWGLQTWMQIGGPRKFSIVELGPGRGTLSKDILRVFKQFKHITSNDVSLHLVEISPFLATVQCASLTAKNKNPIDSSEMQLLDPLNSITGKPYYHHAIASESGFPIYWYRGVRDLPQDFHFYIAHEFFDALPIHKLQKVEGAWREVLVDIINPQQQEDSAGFRYVVSRNETPVIKLLQQQNYYAEVLQKEDKREHIEVSIDGLGILSTLVNRLNLYGGLASIIDYGHNGEKQDTFRGFYKHELHDPLIDPGKADLTADVDFSIIRKVFSDQIMMCGPVSQHEFLTRLGIEKRLNILLDKSSSSKDKENLSTGYKMIMEDMGKRFQVVTLLPKILKSHMPDLQIAGY